MIYILQGEELTIKVKSVGAELCSVRVNETGQEIMWSADFRYWKKTSPILFPFVGRLRNGEYRYEGKNYKMGVHGFAREMEFELLTQDEKSLWFTLRDTPKTFKMYPFHFTLELGYELEGKCLKVLWRVKNENDRTMYFALGGHPAFACPLGEKGKRSDCYLLFDRKDEIICSEILSTGLTGAGRTRYELEDGYLNMREGIFDHDALVVEHGQVHSVAVCGPDKLPYVRVDFDVPLFGVWSMPSEKASFVCIEPWYGRCDSENFTGDLSEREWENTLEAGKVFEKGYTITVEI